MSHGGGREPPSAKFAYVGCDMLASLGKRSLGPLHQPYTKWPGPSERGYNWQCLEAELRGMLVRNVSLSWLCPVLLPLASCRML
jgi:hypothetical protein